MTELEDLIGIGYWKPEDKPLSYEGMVDQFAVVTGQEGSETLYQSLIAEEFSEWSDEVWGTDEAEIKELVDLLYVIFGYARVKGWDIREAFKRVHENNLGRCLQPDGTVKLRDDGKIIKNPDYPKVDLKDLV